MKASTFTKLQTRSELQETRELIAWEAVKITLHFFEFEALKRELITREIPIERGERKRAPFLKKLSGEFWLTPEERR